MILVVQSADADHIAEAADYAVLSLPNGLACQLAPELLRRGVRVDLSADFRYRSLEQWSQVAVQEASRLSRDDSNFVAMRCMACRNGMGLPSPRPDWWRHPVAFLPPA